MRLLVSLLMWFGIGALVMLFTYMFYYTCLLIGLYP